MQANTTLPKKLVKYFFPLAAFEGLLALIFLLKDPSAEGALLLGYSASRLALAGAALLLTAVMAWAAWQSLTNRPTLPRWTQRAETWLLEKNIPPPIDHRPRVGCPAFHCLPYLLFIPLIPSSRSLSQRTPAVDGTRT